MSNIITTHNSDGKAVFSTTIPEEHHDLPIPGGKLNLHYTIHSFPSNLSTEDDIKQYAHDRTNGLSQESPLCPPQGVAMATVHLPPNASSMMHRTMTLDMLVILEGVVELILESGEKRTLKAGDTVVQRGTLHQWTNVTPNDGWVKIIGLAMPIIQPFEIAGKTLGMEWLPSVPQQ